MMEMHITTLGLQVTCKPGADSMGRTGLYKKEQGETSAEFACSGWIRFVLKSHDTGFKSSPDLLNTGAKAK